MFQGRNRLHLILQFINQCWVLLIVLGLLSSESMALSMDNCCSALTAPGPGTHQGSTLTYIQPMGFETRDHCVASLDLNLWSSCMCLGCWGFRHLPPYPATEPYAYCTLSIVLETAGWERELMRSCCHSGLEIITSKNDEKTSYKLVYARQKSNTPLTRQKIRVELSRMATEQIFSQENKATKAVFDFFFFF